MDKYVSAIVEVGLPADGTGKREACPKQWYALRVRSCCERKVSQKISLLGLEALVPIQKEVHNWSDRKKVIDRIVIPMIVFVKMTRDDIMTVRDLSFVYDVLKAPGARDYAVIPDKQIRDFQLMLSQCQERVEFDNSMIAKGMNIRVVRGLFKGLEGVVSDVNSSKTRVYVSLDILGCANILIDVKDIELT